MKGVIRWKRGKKVYLLDGREVTEHVFLEAFPDKPIGLPMTETQAAWPILSDAVGIHPDQVDEAREECKRLGVPTDFKDDGRVVFTSRAHRKEYLRAHGYYDRNGGYGD